MKEEKLMHVKLEFENSLKNKRELLEMQMHLLKTVEAIKRYKELRIEELKNKKRIGAKLKKANTNLNKLKKVVPQLKVPKKYKSPNNKKSTAKKKSSEPQRQSKVHNELQEIQEKLKAINEKF